ncbi:hypothetical protein CBS101457_005313 [Exobasidium rhododendri]|nr:hypothetical protein CBS101457_005313 [Exobasidium rhododendri]
MTRSALMVLTSTIISLLIATTSAQGWTTPAHRSSSLTPTLDNLPNARPHHSERKFTSRLVENELARVSALIKDKALERIWTNAFPNTLDTTVMWHDDDKKKAYSEAFPRTFLVTGDITAFWLRDSTSQMNPYLHLLQKHPDPSDEVAVKDWDKLYRLALGLLYMQSQAVLTHPYANSFGPPDGAKLNDRKSSDSSSDWLYPPAPGQYSHWGPSASSNFSNGIPNDGTTIWEGKWEVDSLANFFRLAVNIAKMSNRTDFVHNRTWRMASQMAISALHSQQRGTEAERKALEEAFERERKESEAMQSAMFASNQEDVQHGTMFHTAAVKPDRWRVHEDEFAIQGRRPAVPNARKRQTPETTKKVLTEEEKLRIGKGKQSSSVLLDDKSDDTSEALGNGASGEIISEWERRFEPLAGGIYRFQRAFRSASETKSENGFGEPAKYTGMVKSAFRPSDDATILPFFVPGNAQLAAALSDLVAVLDSHPRLTEDKVVKSIRDDCDTLAGEINTAIERYAIVNRKDMGGDVYAYEVDGYGSNYFMDDANIPSLLSLPYLGFVKSDDPTYLRTRKMVLSKETNKYLFNGTAGWAIGGPHVGYGYGWPMSRSMQILTTTSREEQLDALSFLRSTTAGTGLIHESVNVDNPSDFTRSWFAWTNGLYGEAILHVLSTNPDLLTDHVY